MSTQQAKSTPSAPASIVGNAFVIKYYNTLHHNPEVVYRFYTDNSKLSRAEASPNASVDSVTTLGGIHEKIMSLDSSLTVEIITVDSQESLEGNVLVMVIGALHNADGVKRSFVQTFVLAPQDKSYYVINDMFRYLDVDDKQSQLALQVDGASGQQSMAAANAGVDEEFMSGDSEPSIPSEPHSPEHPPLETHEDLSVEEQFDSSEHAVEVSGVADIAIIDKPNLESSSSLLKGNDIQIRADQAEDAPKKSYASILLVPSSKTSHMHNERPALSAVRHVDHSASLASLSQSTQASGHPKIVNPTQENPVTFETEGDGKSVYARNLPYSVTVADLEKEFSKFGQIKSGVNLRNQGVGVCFAFIEFEEVTSAQSTLEASPIIIGGRQVYIAEKKVSPFRGGRGRFDSAGRGRGYQGEMMRGRGYYNSRGMGRAGLDMDRDFDRGGRGNMSSHGGYGGGNYYSSNTLNSYWLTVENNGFRPPR